MIAGAEVTVTSLCASLVNDPGLLHVLYCEWVSAQECMVHLSISKSYTLLYVSLHVQSPGQHY